MRLQRFIGVIFGLGVLFGATSTLAEGDMATKGLPWSVLFYRGVTTENTLGQLFGLKVSLYDEVIYSAELAHELAVDNPIRRFLKPIVSTVEIAGSITYRHDHYNIYDLAPYLIFRWRDFPWDHWVQNTYAIGWGISYVTSIPSFEQIDSHNTKRLLNYLMFETTLAAPKYPQWQLVLRMHHRSGCYGLYGADNVGSTAVGIGIRYLF